MLRRLLLGLVLVATLPLAGSISASSLSTQKATDLRLVAFSSCPELLRELRAAATDSVGPWGFPGAVAPGGAIAGGARTAAQTAAPSSSGTNTAEADADEPDIVKTDGRRVLTVANGTLRVFDAKTHKATGKITLGVRGGQTTLLLSGDHALVLTGGAMIPAVPPQLFLIDLAGPARLVSRYQGEGTLVDARQTGSVARVVLKTAPKITLPASAVSDERRLAANRAAIGRAPLDAWLPSWSVTTGGRTTKGALGCDQVSRPTSFSGTSMVSVLTFDLAAAALGDGDPVGIAADTDLLYSTGSRLYLASDQRWRLDLGPGRATLPVAQRTELYRFDLSGARRPVFAASGVVPGFLVNQYALSEWDGRLRVATTFAGSSSVRVLTRQGESLVQTGIVDGLGRGEQIYSVRFIGPRAYVVTFRQTDPLTVIDLSDPAEPVVSGHLELTGYSAHLQPAGDGKLIGIGQDVSGSGRTRGTQISLFDVTDPAAPRRLARHVVEGGQSGAEWDPHALLYWPATQLLVVPVSQFFPLKDAEPKDSALALRVTGGGLKLLGELTQPQAPTIRRTFVAGGALWTMSDAGLQTYDLSTMERVAWLPL